MPIKMSKALIAKLPAEERDQVEKSLWDKSGGRCFLCEEELNRAADDIEADHDVPESEGGPTAVANLNLAHVRCNRAKRAAKTVPVRPYLKFSAYVRRNGGRLKYDGCFDHFDISPKPSYATLHEKDVAFEFPDGSKFLAPVMTETNVVATFGFVFAVVPRSALFNDDECQPRVIKPEHVWAIYSDLQSNPLHEPPSCRLSAVEGGKTKLLMFDGQHKTVANWMLGREHVVVKIYLDLSTPATIRLVNSIQAKIKKLPLSPFELAAKMSDEWQGKLAEYEEQNGSENASEAGFIEWLPQNERARGKEAFKSGLIQTLLGSAELRMTGYVKQPGRPEPAVSITEQTLKSKVVEKLLLLEPQKATGEDAAALRAQEAANVIDCLNTLSDLALEPQGEAKELTSVEAEAARRMTYQSALAHVASLIRELWGHTTMRTGKFMMTGQLSDTQLETIRTGIRRIAEHPVWRADFNRDAGMQAVKVALEKNQNVPTALEAVGLTLSYLVVGPEDSAFKNYWRNSS